MGQKEKLIQKLRSRPRDFSFDEAETLLHYMGFKRCNKGKTSGSRVKFVDGMGNGIFIHRPHPGSVLKPYQIRQILDVLEERRLV